MLCSCEYQFELGNGDNPDKLSVVCVVNEEGKATINVETAVNFDHKNTDHVPLELSSFSFKVNGQERRLDKIEKIDSSIWYTDNYKALNLWVAEGRVQPGDKIELSVSSKTAPEASGSIVMPAPISIVKMDKEIVELTDFFNERKNEKYNFDIEIDDWKEDEYYGVKLMYESQDTLYVDDDEPEIMYYKRFMYPTEIKYNEGSLDDMLSEVGGGNGKWMYSYYNGQGMMLNSYHSGLFLTSGKQMSDNHIRFQTDCSKSFVRDYVSFDYDFDEENEEWIEREVNVHAIHHGRYFLRVYRISPEFYRYNRALYILDNDFLAELGLSSNSYSYSNIKGGLGMLGGITASEEVSFEAPVKIFD